VTAPRTEPTATKPYTRLLSSVLTVALITGAVVIVRVTAAPSSPSSAKRLAAGESSAGAATTQEAAAASAAREAAAARAAGRTGSVAPVRGVKTTAAGTVTPGKVVLPQGVTDKEISVVYYWNDRTGASPYLNGSGDGNLDEGDSFTSLVAYINKHANGGATFMGFPFNLHGRKIKPTIVESGKYPDTYAAAAAKIVQQIKPFGAVSSHGSASTYICDPLARAHIFNFTTYDLSPGIVQRTGGWCLPSGLSFDGQIEASVNYLTAQAAKTTYQGTETPGPRRYGLLYAEYPGLVETIPALEKRLKDAGVNVVDVESLPVALQDAQQQAPNKVAKFKAKGVNTIIAPDAGAPLNFTHAATAAQFYPDWYIWPCSGQDSTGMVRLYNAAQWQHAAGLTCYDAHFDADLTNNDIARQSEWWKHYQQGRGENVDPPAPTPYVYAGLVPLLIGVTNAGPNLTVDSFRAGIKQFQPYRYDAVAGRTSNPASMLLTFGAPDASPFGDVAKLYWSPTAGDKAAGAYVYPEPRRYERTARF
jgi:hypothetical protein